jgi:hypothetical protein
MATWYDSRLGRTASQGRQGSDHGQIRVPHVRVPDCADWVDLGCLHDFHRRSAEVHTRARLVLFTQPKSLLHEFELNTWSFHRLEILTTGGLSATTLAEADQLAVKLMKSGTRSLGRSGPNTTRIHSWSGHGPASLPP